MGAAGATEVTPSPKISDESVEKALHWLIAHADVIGKAKERTVLAGHMLKHIEALLSKASDEKSVEARKNDARTDKRWVDAIREDAVAAGEYERLRALREAAALKIEAWRSEQATMRAMKI
jgi:hypothetical protein